MKASHIYFAGAAFLVAVMALLVFSQTSTLEIYGTYYNDPLDNNNHEAPYPCIMLRLNRDGTFQQAAYLSAQKVMTLQGTYKIQDKSLSFSDFIFYDYQISSQQQPLHKAFMKGRGQWQAGLQRWFGDISIPSGNDEDNYYVKPRGGRCSALP